MNWPQTCEGSVDIRLILQESDLSKSRNSDIVIVLRVGFHGVIKNTKREWNAFRAVKSVSDL